MRCAIRISSGSRSSIRFGNIGLGSYPPYFGLFDRSDKMSGKILQRRSVAPRIAYAAASLSALIAAFVKDFPSSPKNSTMLLPACKTA